MEQKQQSKPNMWKLLVMVFGGIVGIWVLYRRWREIKYYWDALMADDEEADWGEDALLETEDQEPSIEDEVFEGEDSYGFGLNGRQEQIYNLVKLKREVGMGEVSSLVKDVTERTLRRDLNKLEKLGLILQAGKTRDAVYKLRE